MTIDGDGISFWGEGMFWKLSTKAVNFMVCGLYLVKLDAYSLY